MKLNKNWTLSILALVAVVGCSGGDNTTPETHGGGTAGGDTKVSGSISIDGSTTVYPIVSLMAEDFGQENPDVKVDATKSGTGSGFKKFIEGKLDICTASRTIEESEVKECGAKGVEFIEVPIAYDGVSVVVNTANAGVSDLTADELKKAWMLGSTVTKWSDIRADLPGDKITFYGPTDNHGTYEYFTEKINGKKNEIRKEYQPNQEYTAIVEAVKADKNGFAYMGYSYYIENKDALKAVKIDGVEATPETIANGTYKPLSRTLFLYVNKKSYDARPELKKFVDYALNAGTSTVEEADYVKLPDDVYKLVKDRVAAGKTGSIFLTAEKGKSTLDILNAAK